jgi:hypothetical protein
LHGRWSRSESCSRALSRRARKWLEAETWSHCLSPANNSQTTMPGVGIGKILIDLSHSVIRSSTRSALASDQSIKPSLRFSGA